MLTSPIDKLIDHATEQIHGLATSSAQWANKIAKALLSMSDADATAWMRARADLLETIFGRHAIVGNTLNTLLATTAAQLEVATPELVDVRSVADKLADHRRVIDWQTLTISTLPPEPQPEPPAE